ncbi:MAG: hypothetical protein H6830_06765 [Planctomycetes bacterium]|nr:hypothetical protein [Planctomycetota bacterium]MCB9911160.1 hypothetical protein [Planctomycetota bacterium]MCB9911524.1 hypothetical protein [Planctomycetota bacterium]HPF12775.1 hypothetical protein [Planctomycetota bacterium]
MKPLLPILFCAATLASTAFGGDIKVTVIGTVDSNSYSSGPFAGPVFGDTATLTYEVFVPGTDVVPGQLTDYNIDLATFDLNINGPTGAMLAGATVVEVQNDFPAADGFRINQTNLATGHFFSSGWGATSALFTSTDITQLLGTYDVTATLTSFSYSIFGQGGQMEIFPETLIIGLPDPGVPFCDPMDPNSTGQPTHLGASFGSGSGSDLHLEATSGPPTQFGYFLVGDSFSDPGVVVSQGRLCVSGMIGRYNVVGGDLNSLGQFDAAGVLQNLVGTSSVGSGFDVPLVLPLTGSPMILASQTWYFQVWHREDMGFSNFSNGLAVTF